MGKVVGVRFKPSGKSYDFDAGAFVLNTGDKVIVETEQGLGFAAVSIPPRELTDESPQKPLKRVFRVATQEDFAQVEKIREQEKEAQAFCEAQIAELKLPMSLFSVESTFDSNKLTFFFTAEGRVDFRELVKVLVRHYRVRIELRQIGVRHQARMCGGLGRCGRETCCSTFLSNFVPVSVKMAKVQNLSLNPTKISGQCGRLMCCLTFENETYEKLRANFPKQGKTVLTPSGKGKVVRHNVLRGRVFVRLISGGEAEFSVDEVKLAPPGSDQAPDESAQEHAPLDAQAEHPDPAIDFDDAELSGFEELAALENGDSESVAILSGNGENGREQPQAAKRQGRPNRRPQQRRAESTLFSKSGKPAPT
jgi:cell fate regulator YaaT (PSP1 superfamily)